MIPTNYHRVDIVADSYRENSIKSSERNSRRNTVKVMIKSEKFKVPQDFKEFLRNGENKTTFIKVVVQKKKLAKSKFKKKLFVVKYLFYNHLSTYCENLDVICAPEVVFTENLISIVITDIS